MFAPVCTPNVDYTCLHLIALSYVCTCLHPNAPLFLGSNSPLNELVQVFPGLEPRWEPELQIRRAYPLTTVGLTLIFFLFLFLLQRAT
jgi:hypothetical protein